MANKSLIFYGKPQSFERYELSSGKYTIDERNEPYLKVPSKNDEVLHYFFKDNIFYLELYSYANPCKAVRSGVVIGVGVKSDEPIVASDKNISTLRSLLNQFKEIALSNPNKEFKTLTLNEINEFNSLIQDAETVAKILQEFKTSDSQKPSHNNLTLLYLNDFKSVDSLKDQICNYSDIYICTDKNVFNDDLNIKVFAETQKKIHVVENGKIKLPKENKKPQGQPMPQKPINHTVELKETDENKKAEDVKKFMKWTKRWINIFIGISTLYLFLFIAFFWGTNSPLDKWFPPKQVGNPATETPTVGTTTIKVTGGQMAKSKKEETSTAIQSSNQQQGNSIKIKDNDYKEITSQISLKPGQYKTLLIDYISPDSEIQWESNYEKILISHIEKGKIKITAQSDAEIGFNFTVTALTNGQLSYCKGIIK